ncbi:mitochondrial RNA binding complex 1 subunit [Trypanosoma cruzi cruzi]|nr:mitochondrial RNA binding complex 1 subunit [Trypanosoma cruzi cruzi]
MLSALSTAAPAAIASAVATRPAPLDHIFQRCKLNLVEFTAQDIYQVCTTAYNMDTIGMTQDPDFMRGIHDAFRRSDQTVLSPFQANLIADTFRKVGIISTPNEVAVPEEEAVSPESLIMVLRTMNITKQRDERKMNTVLKLMFPILDEFSPTQLSLTVTELARLKCTNTDFLGKLAKRIIEFNDDLSPLDISLTAKSLAYCPGVSHNILRRVFQIVEERMSEFQPEDYVNVLHALNALGSKFLMTFRRLVECGLEHVENMDAVTLTNYLVCFSTMDYRQLEHVEIYADALVEVATDLSERDLVQAFIALQSLQLLSDTMFGTMASCAMRYAPKIDPRNIAPIMDICSTVPHPSEPLMKALLDRAMECTRILTPKQLGEILNLIGLYPPAREHPLVQMFGKQARLRLDLMGPDALAGATRGLANLGYADPEFYIQAAETGFRYGFKDWSLLEPILMGLSITAQCSPTMVRVLGSHLAPMARSMSLLEIERANRYMKRLGCEDDFVYKAMASRVLQFVKEITPDMPEELQILLQRGAVEPSTAPGVM